MLLGATFTNTEEPIRQTRERNKKEGLQKVMPFMTTGYVESTFTYNGKEIPIFTVTEKGNFLGAALKVTTDKGYSGDISFLLGLDSSEHITGFLILEQRETPGLGAKAEGQKWWGQFIGKFKPDFIFKVDKDGGNVDSITASTITSRAISNAIDEAMDAYHDYVEKSIIK